MKNPFKRTNQAPTAVVPRSNVGDGLYGDGTAATNLEQLWDGQTRYCDPLIRDHVIEKTNATHRERVAAEDVLGCLVTRYHSLLGWARAPKFYASDELGAPEIMPEVRQIYDLLKLGDLCSEVAFEVLKHGWAGSYMWLAPDENARITLRAEIYSAVQISMTDIIRDDKNDIQAWLVRGRYPVVPAGYSRANLKTIYRQFTPGMDGWIVHTRGDYNKTLGYGYSRLVDLWDPITKLRVVSFSDAKRNEIFPLVTYPSSYDQEQIDALFESLSHVDENAGLALMSAEDSEGNPLPGLPTLAWRTPAEDAPNVSGEGGPRGLPTELFRFCALSGITVKELAGDPGGAQEAGATDIAQALERNITEWNYSSRPILEKILRQLERWGIITLPPTFVIKGHWEWERDEALAAQAQVQDEQMDIEHEKAEKKPAAQKKNAALLDIAENAMIEYAHATHLLLRENAMPGVMAPITSSWVKSYGYDDNNFYLQFHGAGSKIFRYPYVDDPEALASEMEMGGSPGGTVHDHPDLGVPRRTPYDTMSQLPDTMEWWGGSQALTEYESEDSRIDKTRAFGTRRPAAAPNARNYPAQTAARTEQTTGPARGAAAASPSFLPSLLTLIRGQMGQNLTGKTPTATGTTPAAVSTATQYEPLPNVTAGLGMEQAAGREFGPGTGRGTPGHEWNPTKPSLHGGRSKRGRPSTAGMAGQYSTMVPDYAYNAAPIEVKRANASLADLSYDAFNTFAKSVTGGHTFSKDTFTRFRSLIERYNGLVERENYRAAGNSMSFKNHPYLYHENGQIVVEYPCARDWRANVVGKTKKLKINVKNCDVHGDVDVGTITYGWDEKNDCPADVLDYDRENVMRLLEEAGNTGCEVYARLEAGADPDVSTEYSCHIENHAGRRWQRGFVAGDTCFVNRGNCPSGKCDFVAAEPPES